MYKRVLLKLSGESLGGPEGKGLSPECLNAFASEIVAAVRGGAQVAIVNGGGNIFRGLQGVGKGFDRVTGDRMGMLATIINSLALSCAIKSQGVNAEVFTATPLEPYARYYTRDNALKVLEDGGVALIAGGTGNPFFTTDSGAALRALELGADALLKGTRVDGVYTADPEKDPTATKFDEITFDEIYNRNLKVMDLTATTMCKENGLSIYVFNMDIPGNLKKVIAGEPIGTLVHK
jgi:uridylate kinase